MKKLLISLTILLGLQGVSFAEFTPEEESHLKSKVAYELKLKEYRQKAKERSDLLRAEQLNYENAVKAIDDQTVAEIEFLEEEAKILEESIR